MRSDVFQFLFFLFALSVFLYFLAVYFRLSMSIIFIICNQRWNSSRRMNTLIIPMIKIDHCSHQRVHQPSAVPSLISQYFFFVFFVFVFLSYFYMI
jgi:hypothetical protein